MGVPFLDRALARMAALHGCAIDMPLVVEVAARSETVSDAIEQLNQRISNLRFEVRRQSEAGAQDQTPALIFLEDECGIVRGKNGRDQWVVEFYDAGQAQWQERQMALAFPRDLIVAAAVRPRPKSSNPLGHLLWSLAKQRKSALFQVILAGCMINIIALLTSFYSMQVYDRVIPTGAVATLIALTIGVTLAHLFELAVKFLKSTQAEIVNKWLDEELSRAIFTRYFQIRLDAMPASLGDLASRLKSYEMVRQFFIGMPMQLLVDIPFVLIFSVFIFSLCGWLIFLPLGFFCLAVLIGYFYKNEFIHEADLGNASSNRKFGLIVETIQGAETIKSGHAGWRVYAKMSGISQDALDSEYRLRKASEKSQYYIAFLSQLAYVGMVALGSLLIAQGGLTMGGLIACTIMAGRMLGPLAVVPQTLVQWAQTKSALKGLNELWNLPLDYDEGVTPLIPADIQSSYLLKGVEFNYGKVPALKVSEFKVAPGERIAILGPIGSGKSTLLKLLSGMYKPTRGAVLLDGMDINHVSKPFLAEQIGYLQQDGRLFSGTLRENLVLGVIDPGDQVILEAAKKTGLYDFVLAKHPQGLSQPVFEGGAGFSGGQRQLINLTRLYIRKPKIWLLDEPTANMDRNSEVALANLLNAELKPEDTLVLVTHKPELLRLVNRIVLIVNNEIILDGERNEVLQKLQPPPGAA